jgi:hypothetical protein
VNTHFESIKRNSIRRGGGLTPCSETASQEYSCTCCTWRHTTSICLAFQSCSMFSNDSISESTTFKIRHRLTVFSKSIKNSIGFIYACCLADRGEVCASVACRVRWLAALLRERECVWHTLTRQIQLSNTTGGTHMMSSSTAAATGTRISSSTHYITLVLNKELVASNASVSIQRIPCPPPASFSQSFSHSFRSQAMR